MAHSQVAYGIAWHTWEVGKFYRYGDRGISLFMWLSPWKSTFIQG